METNVPIASLVLETFTNFLLKRTASADTGTMVADAAPIPSKPESFKNDLLSMPPSWRSMLFILPIVCLHSKITKHLPPTSLDGNTIPCVEQVLNFSF